MKKLMLISCSIMILSAHEGFAVPKCENSRTIRVRLNGCTPPEKDLTVFIGGQYVDLPIKSKNVFEGSANGLTVNPTFALAIDGQPLCCTPFATMKKNPCVVEYIAACDTRDPAWDLTADSEKGIEFDFDFQHPLGASGNCPPPAMRVKNKNTVKNLGERDVVRLTVKRGNRTAVSFLVLPQDLAQGTLRRPDLEAKVDEMAQQGAQQFAGNSGDLVKDQKKLLPESITLTKKQ